MSCSQGVPRFWWCHITLSVVECVLILSSSHLFYQSVQVRSVSSCHQCTWDKTSVSAAMDGLGSPGIVLTQAEGGGQRGNQAWGISGVREVAPLWAVLLYTRSRPRKIQGSGDGGICEGQEAKLTSVEVRVVGKPRVRWFKIHRDLPCLGKFTLCKQQAEKDPRMRQLQESSGNRGDTHLSRVYGKVRTKYEVPLDSWGSSMSGQVQSKPGTGPES